MNFVLRVRTNASSSWVELPIPDYDGYQVDIYDVDAQTTGRDQHGLMHRDRVAVKRKVFCTWSNRKRNVISSILSSPITNVFFQLEYWDPQTNAQRTGTFYVGDRSMPLTSATLHDGLLGSVSINFIER